MIYLNRYGDNKIGARVYGIELKNEVRELLKSNPQINITFDFTGIDYISSGFAKELFGELFIQLGKEFNNKISIKIPQENQIIKEIIIRAIKSCK
jgi:hypothetical protein